MRRATGWRVDLTRPALTIHIEMLPQHAFFFFGKEPGAGGLPTGSSGRLACLLSGGIDSPVAAYRMMRRGCSVLFIHFHSYPILSRASQEKVREIVRLLTRSQLRSQLVLSDQNGELIMPVIHSGRPERGMPPIPMPDEDARAVVEYIHSMAALSPACVSRPPVRSTYPWRATSKLCPPGQRSVRSPAQRARRQVQLTRHLRRLSSLVQHQIHSTRLELRLPLW